MFPSITLLSLISIALTAVDAGPVGRRTTGNATLSLMTRTTFNEHGNQTFADIDLARAQAQALQERDQVTGSLSVKNQNFRHTVDIGVGTPPISYTVVIDTSSAITWVGASSHKAYVETSTSHDTGKPFHEAFGKSTTVDGKMYDDTVTLGDLVIHKQSIGMVTEVKSTSMPFSNELEGVLGLGLVPLTLAAGDVSDNQLFPTVMDNLVARKLISEKILGVYFVPSNERTKQGALTFGGFDGSVIPTDKQMHYVSATNIFTAGSYLGIEQSITYGPNHETILPPSTIGIIDTGATLVMLPTDAFQKYQKATGATMDPTTDMLTITPQQYTELQDLTFNIGDKPFTLTPNAQIWPRTQNTLPGGRPDAIYLIVAELNVKAVNNLGFHFIMGYTFIERFYTVFDMTNRKIGLAETMYTRAIIN